MEFKEGDKVVIINVHGLSDNLSKVYTVLKSELNTDGNSVIKVRLDSGDIVTRYSWRFRKLSLLEKELMEIED